MAIHICSSVRKYRTCPWIGWNVKNKTGKIQFIHGLDRSKETSLRSQQQKCREHFHQLHHQTTWAALPGICDFGLFLVVCCTEGILTCCTRISSSGIPRSRGVLATASFPWAAARFSMSFLCCDWSSPDCKAFGAVYGAHPVRTFWRCSHVTSYGVAVSAEKRSKLKTCNSLRYKISTVVSQDTHANSLLLLHEKLTERWSLLSKSMGEPWFLLRSDGRQDAVTGGNEWVIRILRNKKNVI